MESNERFQDMNKNLKPIIFIGMPVYNSEKTIRATLESIIAQDYNDWQLLISDNYSLDKTREICEEFVLRDKRVTFIQQNLNIGAWNNFIYVLQNSRGPYFKFQAADDVLSVNYLNENIHALEMDSSLIGSTSPDCWDWEYQERLSPVNFELKGSQRLRLKTLRKNCWRSNGIFYAIYRKTDLEKVITDEIFSSHIAILDWLILARLTKLGNINRHKSGLMILGSSGASNSADLTWLNQLIGLRRKLMPYSGFYSLIKRNCVPLKFLSKIEIMQWIFALQINHFKGLLALTLNLKRNP